MKHNAQEPTQVSSGSQATLALLIQQQIRTNKSQEALLPVSFHAPSYSALAFSCFRTKRGETLSSSRLGEHQVICCVCTATPFDADPAERANLLPASNAELRRCGTSRFGQHITGQGEPLPVVCDMIQPCISYIYNRLGAHDMGLHFPHRMQLML